MKNGGDNTPLGMIHGVIKTFLEFPVVALGPGSAQTLRPGNCVFCCVIGSDASESSISFARTSLFWFIMYQRIWGDIHIEMCIQMVEVSTRLSTWKACDVREGKSMSFRSGPAGCKSRPAT